MTASGHEVTELLQVCGGGNTHARDRLMTLVYQDLRRRAAIYLRREPPGHTLQPTALVHEAYLRLIDQRSAWHDRAHFFAIASQMMRRVLLDHARARQTAKRSGTWTRITLAEGVSHPESAEVDVIALDAALAQLATFDARKAQIAELRFFAGLTLEEAGEVLGVSLATVERDWQAARAWLAKALSGMPRHDP